MTAFLISLARAVYGVYAVTVFGCLAFVLVPIIAVVPGLETRRVITRLTARAVFLLSGIPLSVRHLDRLPKGPCVVAANHASYLDGIILKAVLPPRFSFVIKNEMMRFPLASLLLRRIGSEFVERFDRTKGATDARRLFRSAVGGQALAFFPEGTFRKSPGLGRFHNGAFAAASRARVPVVPVIIKGSRQVLPQHRRLPRPGRVQVLVQPPILPDGNGAAAIRQLNARTRASILTELGEPDLHTAPEIAPSADEAWG